MLGTPCRDKGQHQHLSILPARHVGKAIKIRMCCRGASKRSSGDPEFPSAHAESHTVSPAGQTQNATMGEGFGTETPATHNVYKQSATPPEKVAGDANTARRPVAADPPPGVDSNSSTTRLWTRTTADRWTFSYPDCRSCSTRE